VQVCWRYTQSNECRIAPLVTAQCLLQRADTLYCNTYRILLQDATVCIPVAVLLRVIWVRWTTIQHD